MYAYIPRAISVSPELSQRLAHVSHQILRIQFTITNLYLTYYIFIGVRKIDD